MIRASARTSRRRSHRVVVSSIATACVVLGTAGLAACFDLSGAGPAPDGAGVDASAPDGAADSSPAGEAGNEAGMPLGALVKVADGQTGARFVALSTTEVYWSTGAGSIVAAPRSGGALRPVVQSAGVLDIFIDGPRVVWGSNANNDVAIAYANTDGTGPGSYYGTGGGGLTRIAVDSVAFWGARDINLVRAPRTGSPSTFAQAGTGKVIGLAADGLAVYFFDTETIYRAPGGLNATIFQAKEVPVDIAVDEKSVFWLNGTGTIMRLDKDKAGLEAPKPLTEGIGGLARMALDGDTLYFTAGGSVAGKGKVGAVPKAGGPVTEIAADQNGPFGIAVDATGVYWANYGDGTVMGRKR